MFSPHWGFSNINGQLGGFNDDDHTIIYNSPENLKIYPSITDADIKLCQKDRKCALVKLCDDGMQGGICDCHNKKLDKCDVCGGDAVKCEDCGKVTDCNGVCDGKSKLDKCGVCDGDNSSCLGCDGVPNSKKVFDECGDCDGDNSSCLGCDGVPK